MPEEGESRTWAGLFKLRGAQWALIVALLSAVGALFVTSVLSVAAHDYELDGIFSEEGDGTAMTFVQRESFGVIFELDSWARDDSSARDVQVARALLGQRLQVVTVSGVTTYELTGESYRASLNEVDRAIRALENLPREERVIVRGEIDALVQNFATQTRELSAIFQQITRDRAVEAVEQRAVFEQLQAMLAGLIVAMGVVLAGWLAADLRQTYRHATRRLLAESRRLESARRRLAFRQQLDLMARSWSDDVARGDSTIGIVTKVTSDLSRLMPDVDVDVMHDHEAPHLLRVQNTDRLHKRATHSADIAAAIDRANGTLALADHRDLDNRRREAERLHDPLTGLPNRQLLVTSVNDAIARAGAQRGRSVIGLAFVDIDRFAEFNTSFGHAEGDRLLITFADRLRGYLHHEHTVLRLSADEFAVVGVFASERHATRVIDGIGAEVSRIHAVGDQPVAISATVGAVVSAALDDGAEHVIQRADAALAAAQTAVPRHPLRYFTVGADGHLMGVMREESALRAALHTGEFVMHYQPIVTLATGMLAGCEALVRWHRPDVGTIAPNDFLPAIARAGLMVDLGWQIIEQSLSAWGRQREAAAGLLDDLYVSINLDAAQLAIPTLADYIITAAERSGVPLRCVALEVTEHALLNGDEAIGQLSKLRAHGMRVALDDFGTGYSSLSRAASLPLDILKIDRGFLPDASLGHQQHSLIRDILSIATTLDLVVTAEGIETEAVADDLREMGIEYGQGWHYARPMPIDELAAWITKHSAAIATPQ